MPEMPQMPQLTPLGAVTQMIMAAVYLGVGGAALGQAPGDVRTRVFLAMAVANAVGSTVPTIAWLLGVTDPLAFDRIPLGLMLASLAVGAVLLFHFSQVFPRQRPWIRDSGIQLPVAYAIVPAAVFLLVRWWPADPAQMTAKFGLTFLVFGFPLMVLLGLVLPVASILALLRSLRESATTGEGEPDARTPLAGILLSQVAGGVLAVLVVGPLEMVAPESIALTFVSITVWCLALLTPLAFAAAVWKYRVLEIAPGASAEVQPD